MRLPGIAAAAVLSGLMLGVGIAAPSMPGVRSSFAILDRCVARLDPLADVGFERVAARCPDLASALANSPWAGWLPPDWKSSGYDLSAASLRDLRALVSRELAVRALSPPRSIDSLQPILNRLEVREAEGGRWSRFKAWLGEVFAAPEESSSKDSWLSGVMARVSVSDIVSRFITWACLAVVVGLAAGIVVNELRVAGLFASRRRPRSAGGVPAADVLVPARVRDWNDVQRAPVVDRPRLLLELIVARLVEQHCLPPSDGLTLRELTRVARLADAADCDLLTELGRTTEEIRFSGRVVAPDSIEAAVERGRTLLLHLGGPSS